MCSGRVCSLDINGHLLYVGDTSSSLKVSEGVCV